MELIDFLWFWWNLGWYSLVKVEIFSVFGHFWHFGTFWNRVFRFQVIWTITFDRGWGKWEKVWFSSFLAQKASKVIISKILDFGESSRKMRGPFFSKGGTQSWPGTAIVNHPLRLKIGRGLSYFPYIFYFVNFTISAAIRQGLFGSFENVIKEFVNFDKFWVKCKKLPIFLTSRIDPEMSLFEVILEVT